MLGQGVYKLSDVARFTETADTTVRSWFRGRAGSVGKGPVFMSDYQPIGGDYAVSFHDMIDLLVAARFRAEGVSLPVIRKAYKILSRELHSNHPFCHNSLYTEGRRIIVHTASNVGDEILSDVVTKQMLFTNLRSLLKHIDYSDVSQQALRWRIHQGVLVDPRINHGKPAVADTGVGTHVLYRYYRANQGNTGLVADLFNVSEMDITNAVQFEERLGSRSAA